MKKKQPMLHAAMAGLSLNEAERHLMEYALSFQSVIRRGHLELPLPGDYIQYYPDADFSDIEGLLDWQIPLLTVAGAALDRAEITGRYFKAGGAALWFPSANPGLPAVPPLQFEQSGRSVFIISDDRSLRRMYRQIFLFAGFDPRMDFTTSDEVFSALESMIREGRSFPYLILLDLDFVRFDAVTFFTRLAAFFRERPGFRKDLRLLTSKDFARPGLDLAAMSGRMKPFIRRIFHPLETIPLLLESFFLYSGNSLPAAPTNFKSIDELIYGRWEGISQFSSQSFWQPFFFRTCLPFFWLFDHLGSEEIKKGAILTPEPGLNSGNLLHSIRSPDSSREMIENTDE